MTKRILIERKQVLRRQFTESFCAPDGSFSLIKTLAIFGQIVMLYNLGRYFDALMDKPESLLIVGSFVVCPDLVRKFVNMKYGNGAAATKG